MFPPSALAKRVDHLGDGLDRSGMTHNDCVGAAGQNSRRRGDLHFNAALFLIAPLGHVALRHDGFLHAPGVGGNGSHDGHLQHGVSLLQSRVLDAVKRGCNVLIAIARSSGADVHDDVLGADAELGHDGVELLCEVDVDGRFRADLLVVCKACGCTDSLVVFIAGGENEDILAGQSFCNLVEELGVLLDVLAAHDDDRHRHSIALETRVKSYKAEKDAAEEAERQRIAAENAAKQEQSRKDQYSGKLPVDGMPVSCLKYTSLGSPTKTEKCQFYDSMDVHRRYKILHWYNSEGQTVAYCHSHQPKGEYTEVIYAFTYYETPIGRPNSAPAWTPPSTSCGSNSGSVRDDYDNPEDLWEDNPDWYEDEDEVWDEWENG